MSKKARAKVQRKKVINQLGVRCGRDVHTTMNAVRKTETPPWPMPHLGSLCCPPAVPERQRMGSRPVSIRTVFGMTSVEEEKAKAGRDERLAQQRAILQALHQVYRQAPKDRSTCTGLWHNFVQHGISWYCGGTGVDVTSPYVAVSTRPNCDRA